MPYQHLHPWRAIRPWERHSLVLTVAGLMYMAIGGSFFNTEVTPSNKKALSVALHWWGMEVWGVIFILAGVLAIISSRWPPISATWGYGVLTGLSSGWAAFYGVGVFFGFSPVSNLRGALVWGLLGFAWWVISGLSNPPLKIDPTKSKTV